MERVERAYWKLHYRPQGIAVEVFVRGRAFLFPCVEPQELGQQIAALRDLLFALSPLLEFSLHDWTMLDR